MPTIRVTCPMCNVELELDAAHAGQEIECGSCLQVFVAEETPRKNQLRRVDDDEDDRGRRSRRSRRSRRDDDDYDDRPRRRQYDDYGPPPKSRVAYILLAVFLGKMGVHNFYAGRIGPGVGQLVLFVVSLVLTCFVIGWLGILALFIWWVVEVCTVEHDGDGRRME